MIEGIEVLQEYINQYAKQHPGDPEVGKLDRWLANGRNIAEESPARGRESLPTPEQLVLRSRFSDLETKRLVGDGGKKFVLSGTTISEQQEARTREGKPSFWHIVNAGDLLLASREDQEVVIFPDLGRYRRLFVDGTFGKDTDTQERLVRAAGNNLADRLDLKNPLGKRTVAAILTDEAATWSDLTFQYLGDTDNKNGIWLFGPEYAKAQGKDWVYGRTKNKTNQSGSLVADVGHSSPAYGLHVFGWRRDWGVVPVGGPFLVVPIDTQA